MNRFPQHANTNNINLAQNTDERVQTMSDEFLSQNIQPRLTSYETKQRPAVIEKIKQHPAFSTMVVAFSTLAVAALGVGFVFGQNHADNGPHHYLTEWENKDQFKIHQAAQISVGDQGADLQIVRDDVDGESGKRFQTVGHLNPNATFTVKHYAVSASSYDQRDEGNAGIKVISLLRDDIPEADRDLGSNEDPFFQIVIKEDAPSVAIDDLNA